MVFVFYTKKFCVLCAKQHPGIEVRTVFFDPVNSLVSGDMTEQEWIDGIISASDQMRANLK